MKKQIFFVTEEGERISFSDWLRQQKQRLSQENRRAVSWREISEIVGVEGLIAYSTRNTEGAPNLPTRNKFAKIVSGLGASTEDFEVVGRLKADYNLNELSEEDLIRVGEGAISRGFDVIRSPLVRTVLGESLYRKCFYGFENQEKFIEKLRAVDSERYGHFRFSPLKSRRGALRHLDAEEVEIIKEYLSELPWNYEEYPVTKTGTLGLPKGTMKDIGKRLKESGKKRTISSLVYHVQRIWNGNRYLHEPQLIRTQNGECDLGDLVNQTLDELPYDSEADELGKTKDNEESKEKRKKFIKEVPIGHQKLLIYMTDPENYKRLLGNDVQLVRADFRRKDCKSKENKRMYEKLHRRVASLESCAEEDEDMVNFADGWMRCDLIYRTKKGEYLVAEVKQNAVNRTVEKTIKGKKVIKHYRNADRAIEQTLGYVGGFIGRITRHNSRHKNEPDFARVPSGVKGFVAAYQVQEDLKEDLMYNGIRYFEILKEEVDKYIEDLMARKRIEKSKSKEAKIKATETFAKPTAEPIVEYGVPAVVPTVSFSYDNQLLEILQHPETVYEVMDRQKAQPQLLLSTPAVKKDDRRKREYQEKTIKRRQLIEELSKIPDGLYVGDFNVSQGLLEIREGARTQYSFDSSGEVLRFLRLFAARGVLRENGHINTQYRPQARIKI